MGKYLNKFYSIIDKIGKHNFILIIFIFIVLITTSLYQTFSLYTENEEVSIVDGIATYSFILNANNNTNSVTISAGESKNMDITVTNATAIPLKYGLYSSIKTNEDSYIYIGYSTATKHKPNGVIPGNTDYTVTIKVYNYSNNDITVNLGVSYGFDNEETLTLGTGYYWIDEPLTLMKTLFSKWDGDHIYYRSDEYRNKIVTASFVDIDTLETNNSSASLSNAVESWKISAGDATDNSVIAWLIAKTDNEYDGYYDLYIGARETIYADSLYALFSQLSALEDIDFTNLDTSLTTDMDFLFRDCTSLVELNLNTTEAKNANFDTANVKSMWSLFGGCANLRRLYINTLDTRKVTIMNTMFFGCASLLNTDPENDPDYEFDLSKCQNFLTNQVTSMAQMFQEASSLTSLDLSKFNTSNVTSIAWMFLGCNNLTNLNLSSFNTNKITNMGYLFNNCRALTSLDLSSFDTSNVTNMYQMFKGCSSLTNLNLSSFNTSKVTTMTSLFQDCSSLTNIDLNSFNTSNVIYMNSMFNGCSNLINLDLSSFNTNKTTNMSGMFASCTNLISDNPATTAKEGLILGTNFNTNSATTIRVMFFGCQNLTKLDLSNFNTSNVTDMAGLFNGCTNLETVILDLDTFDTSNVTDMNSMFNSCTKLNAEIIIRSNNPQTLSHPSMFAGAATATGAEIKVYYTSTTQELVTNMLTTKSSNSNVIALSSPI